jgi:short-subunit dehydrogenase
MHGERMPLQALTCELSTDRGARGRAPGGSMHVLVTGASSGIGEAIARAYGKRAHAITVVARREELLRGLQTELAGTAPVHVLARDLSDPDVVPSLVADAERAHGPIDILVNNAGVQIVDDYHRSAAGDLRALLQVNLTSPMMLTHAVLAGMRERRQGTIVHVASVAAYAAPPGMAAYGASKAGIAAFSEVLAGELKGSGVHVVTVYPGPVKTAMGDYGTNAYESLWTVGVQPWGTPEGLAERLVETISKRRRRLIYPRAYSAVRHVSTAVRPVLDSFTPKLRGRT